MSGVIDVAVVGAGPAGLAAALAAGDLGCEVTLIDAGSGPGGQRYHQDLLFPGNGQARRAAVERLPPSLARIRQARQMRHLAGTMVWRAERDDDGVMTLGVGGLEGGAETTVEVRAVVLATGAAELVLPFPGWDLPGVTTAGAAQTLLQSQGVTVGRRVLVAWPRPGSRSSRCWRRPQHLPPGPGCRGWLRSRPSRGWAPTTPRSWLGTVCRYVPDTRSSPARAQTGWSGP
jgi:Pyridine nucleotide-disulphide oxidoreductase